MATKKEGKEEAKVKKTRKPATKKVTSKKKSSDAEVIQNEEVVNTKVDETVHQEELEEVKQEATESEKTVKEVTVQVEGKVTPAPDELVELKSEDIVTDVKFDELEPADEEQLDPQEVIEEFTEATKKLDDIVSLENTPEETEAKLQEELKKAEEVQEKLKKQIEEQEKRLLNRNSQIWNGITDGWYDY